MLSQIPDMGFFSFSSDGAVYQKQNQYEKNGKTYYAYCPFGGGIGSTKTTTQDREVWPR